MKILTHRLCACTASVLFMSGVAVAQTVPPAWNSTTSYKAGDLVTYGGNTFQCQINETINHPNPHLVGWTLDFLYTGNFNIPVGPSETFTNLTNAWNYIKSARVSPASSITLTLQPNYAESFTSNFSLDHAYGAQISIAGTNTGQVATFKNAGIGFVLDSGHTLAALQGLKIVGPSSGSGGTPSIEVKQKAVLANTSNVTIQSFDIGLESDGGEIDNVSNLNISGFTVDGVKSSGHGAEINFVGAITLDGSLSPTIPLFGFKATMGGSISCPGCTANNCNYGFEADTNGSIYCQGAHVTSPADGAYPGGYYAYNHGTIICENATVTGTVAAFKCEDVGYIDATSANASSYASAGYVAVFASTIVAVSAVGSTSPDGTSNIFT